LDIPPADAVFAKLQRSVGYYLEAVNRGD
jgi:hypothetical protein